MAEKPKIYTVTELNRAAQELLEGTFTNVWVEGEISNFRGVSSSGHCYFCLKDAGAQMDLVAFRGVMSSLRFKLEDGLKVLVCGQISLYLQRGRYQMIAKLIEPQGLGALQMAFEQLKKKLDAEGLFDPARKRPIPAFPQKIGIVTSPTGAAIQDILTVINRRFANVEILIYPAKVQGEGSKEEIAQGVNYLNQNHPDLDVLMVGRGGGSIEDLWAFNEEIVARAIAASKIPVISCVGHEIDFTIADFVADLRAPTPSAAAEIVVKNKTELKTNLHSLRSRLFQNTRARIHQLAEELRGLARSPVFTRPERMIEGQAQTLDDLMSQARDAMGRLVERRKHDLAIMQSKLALLSPQTVLKEQSKALTVLHDKLSAIFTRRIEQWSDALKGQAGRLEALSPLAVLSRGYAIAWAMPEGRILKSAQQVAPGKSIRVRLHEGEIKATVQDSSNGE